MVVAVQRVLLDPVAAGSEHRDGVAAGVGDRIVIDAVVARIEHEDAAHAVAHRAAVIDAALTGIADDHAEDWMLSADETL